MIKFSVCCLFLWFSVVSVLGQGINADCKTDWPDLARYHDDNTKITPPAKNEQRVVFMGDSITDSCDDPIYGGFFQASLTSIAASAAKPHRKCSSAFVAT